MSDEEMNAEYQNEHIKQLVRIVKSVERIARSLEAMSTPSRVKQIADALSEEDRNSPDDIEPKVPKPKIKIVSPGFENTTTTEEVMQDLKEVTPMLETSKSLLCVKNGYMKYVPFQYIVGYKEDKKPYTLGTIQDIKLVKEGKWILKKAWDKFKVMKQ